jgi:hypothetical protein
MNKRAVFLFVLASCLNFLAACSLFKTRPPLKTPTSAPSSRSAIKFPEIDIKYLQNGVSEKTGKILELNETKITFLPAPYWSESLLEIDIDKIYSIKRLDHSPFLSALPVIAGLWGFAGYYAGTGLSGRYKEDLEPARDSKYLMGGCCGMGSVVVVALIPGVLKSPTHDIFKLRQGEKIAFIKRLMGIQE